MKGQIKDGMESLKLSYAMYLHPVKIEFVPHLYANNYFCEVGMSIKVLRFKDSLLALTCITLAFPLCSRVRKGSQIAFRKTVQTITMCRIDMLFEGFSSLMSR